jgi:putative endonuclease
MAKHPRYTEHGWRYDIIAIVPSRLPVHLRDAWRPGLA